MSYVKSEHDIEVIKITDKNTIQGVKNELDRYTYMYTVRA